MQNICIDRLSACVIQKIVSQLGHNYQIEFQLNMDRSTNISSYENLLIMILFMPQLYSDLSFSV